VSADVIADALETALRYVQHTGSGKQALLEEKLEEALRTNEWQPIETAPTDGTEVYGWCEASGHDIVEFWGHGWRVVAYGYDRRPTHWKPIPAPPIVTI
jgi:hypothetical protein